LGAGLFSGRSGARRRGGGRATLNPIDGARPVAAPGVAQRLSADVVRDNPERAKIEALAPRLTCQRRRLHDAPAAAIGSYTDFFAGIHHARMAGCGAIRTIR